MSVVVWDGKTLAADKQASNGNLRRRGKKIWRHGDILIAGTGTLTDIEEMRDWILGGMDKEKFPANDKRDCTLVVVNRSGTLLRFEDSPFPLCYEEDVFAEGSGRDFAYGAMAMGADAAQAVEIASRYDISCGCGVDTLTFEDCDGENA